MTDEPDVVPASGRSVEELDRLSTDELRRLAFEQAEHKHDVEFFWDLVRHLPPSDDLATEDASTGNITGGIGQLVELVADLMGRDLGDTEPLVRARFISYLRGDD
jgi:hypothetical protein